MMNCYNNMGMRPPSFGDGGGDSTPRATAILNSHSDLQALIDEGIFHFIVKNGYSVPDGTYTFKRASTGAAYQYQFSGGELNTPDNSSVVFTTESAVGQPSSLNFLCDVETRRGTVFEINSFSDVQFMGNFNCDYIGSSSTVHTLIFPAVTRFTRFSVGVAEGTSYENVVTIVNDFSYLEEWAYLIGGNATVFVNGNEVFDYNNHQNWWRTPKLVGNFTAQLNYGADVNLFTNQIISPPSGEGSFGSPNDMGQAFPEGSRILGIQAIVSRFISNNITSSLTVQFRSVPADGSLTGTISGTSGDLVAELNVPMPNTLGSPQYYLSANSGFFEPIDVPSNSMIFCVVSAFNAQAASGLICNIGLDIPS